MSAIVDNFTSLINFNQPILWAAIAHIVFNPLFWIGAAVLENRKQFFSKLCGNNKQIGCYFYAVLVFSFGLTRDYLIVNALETQPKFTQFLTSFGIPINLVQIIGFIMSAYGLLLVITSTYQLGITGTFMGDYFGIFMESRVTAFPYTHYENPMYVGSTIAFLGLAFRTLTITGLLITVLIWFGYQTALVIERPFTDKIFEEKAKKDALKAQ